MPVTWVPLLGLWEPSRHRVVVPASQSMSLGYSIPQTRFLESIPRPIAGHMFPTQLAGWYDNPIPTRFLAPIDCLTIPAPVSSQMVWDCPRCPIYYSSLPIGGSSKWHPPPSPSQTSIIENHKIKHSKLPAYLSLSGQYTYSWIFFCILFYSFVAKTFFAFFSFYYYFVLDAVKATKEDVYIFVHCTIWLFTCAK